MAHTRSTQEVFEHHLHLREQDQLEEDIAQMIHYHVQHNG